VKKVLLFCAAFLIANNAIAHSEVSCQYKTENLNQITSISFSLPKKINFGTLVSVEIKQEDGSSPKLSTVVIKDFPYIVLVDVYRIEQTNSNIALIKLSPDKTALEIAYVYMGEKSNMKFYQGRCTSKEL
jgi:hypothetical protein